MLSKTQMLINMQHAMLYNVLGLSIQLKQRQEHMQSWYSPLHVHRIKCMMTSRILVTELISHSASNHSVLYQNIDYFFGWRAHGKPFCLMVVFILQNCILPWFLVAGWKWSELSRRLNYECQCVIELIFNHSFQILKCVWTIKAAKIKLNCLNLM